MAIHAARWRLAVRLAVFLAIALALLVSVSEASASGRSRVIDWSDPAAEVTYPGRWTAAACGVDVPMICVERGRRSIGIVEVGAFPLTEVGQSPGGRPRPLLKRLAREFIADTIAHRASFCGSDYEVAPLRTRNRIVSSSQGIVFGFSGNFGGEPTSELIIIHAAVIGDHVFFSNASAHDATSCEVGENTFSVRDLNRFQRHLKTMVRDLPVPDFVFGP